jgi:hypothetical protein
MRHQRGRIDRQRASRLNSIRRLEAEAYPERFNIRFPRLVWISTPARAPDFALRIFAWRNDVQKSLATSAGQDNPKV